MRARHAAAVLLVAFAGHAAAEPKEQHAEALFPTPLGRRAPVFPRLVAVPWNASAPVTPSAWTTSSVPSSSSLPVDLDDSDDNRGPGGRFSRNTTIDIPTASSDFFHSLNMTTASVSLDLQVTPVEASTTPDCVTPVANAQTVISVVHTATTTFYGDPADYVAPFPEMTTPNLCAQPTNQEGPGRDPLVSGILCIVTGPSANCGGLTLDSPPTTRSLPRPKEVVITFVTTDKNPSVVYSPMATPDFGKETHDQAGDHFPNHTAAPPHVHTRLNLPQAGASREPTPASTSTSTSAPTFAVTAMPTKVIINNKTVIVQPGQTKHVTVDGEVFTINPSEVIGGGTTIRRPGRSHGHDGPKTPLTTVVGTVSVVVPPPGEEPVAVIDGTTVTANPSGTTVVAGGQGIIVIPGAVIFPSSTTIQLPTEPPVLTELFVEGAKMITAIGPTLAVVEGRTITYGEDTPVAETIVNGETITIGPSGVIVGSRTMGGPRASEKGTEIEIIGGATLTQIGESILVVDEATFTVGPGGDGPLTTEVGGEEITIGPDGVFFSTISLPYPFGPTIVTSIVATSSATASEFPIETASGSADGDEGDRDEEGDGDDKEEANKNGVRAAGVSLSLMLFCIAVGVWD